MTHPKIVCLTETHLYQDVADTICPPGYIIAARGDRTKHGGGMIILIKDCLLFEEIDTLSLSVARVAELVTISCNGIIFICCYSGAAPSHLHLLDTLQTRVEHMNDSKFPSLCDRRNAAIMGLVCRLLAGEG